MLRRGVLRGLLVVGGTAALVLPAQAHAGQVRMQDEVMLVQAASGEDNDYEISFPLTGDERYLSVWDGNGNPIEPGEGCWRPWPDHPSSARCAVRSLVYFDLGDQDDDVQLGGSTPFGGLSFEVHAGAGTDGIHQGQGPVQAFGGSGNDLLSTGDSDDVLDGGDGQDHVRAGGGDDLVTGGAWADDLWGEEGDDRIEGGPGGDSISGFNPWDTYLYDDDGGADHLIGGEGGDRLQGGAGADRLEGGADVDAVEYLTHREGVTVTLDGRAGDGAEGEDDLVTDDVEGVVGGPGPDRIMGNDSANHLSGQAGDDVVSGEGEADVLEGWGGADALSGGAGRDRLTGGTAADVLDGGADVDELRSEEGDDRIEARDGAVDATIACGTGRGDVAVLDEGDRPVECERREFPRHTEEDLPALPVVGSWSSGRSVSTPGTVTWRGDLVTSPAGDVIASWGEDPDDATFGEVMKVAVRTIDGALTTSELDLRGSYHPAQLLVDGLGTAWARWLRTDGTTRVATRAPGGRFGAGQDVVDDVGRATLVVNRLGDAAVVGYAWRERRLVARVRPRGGSWGAQVPVSEELPEDGIEQLDAVLTDRGEVVVGLQQEVGTGSPAVVVASRSADGIVRPLQRLHPDSRDGTTPHLASDAGGNVVALFTEHARGAYGRELRLARKAPDGAFAPSLAVPGSEWEVGGGHLAVTDDGRVTVAFSRGGTARVVAGRPPLPLRPVASFPAYGSDTIGLAQSRTGATVLTWSPDGAHEVTALGSADLLFTPTQDLRRECGHGELSRVAIDDLGRAFALVGGAGGLAIAEYTPPVGLGAQGCLPASLYRQELSALEPPEEPPVEELPVVEEPVEEPPVEEPPVEEPPVEEPPVEPPVEEPLVKEPPVAELPVKPPAEDEHVDDAAHGRPDPSPSGAPVHSPPLSPAFVDDLSSSAADRGLPGHVGPSPPSVRVVSVALTRRARWLSFTTRCTGSCRYGVRVVLRAGGKVLAHGVLSPRRVHGRTRVRLRPVRGAARSLLRASGLEVTLRLGSSGPDRIVRRRLVLGASLVSR